MTNNKDSFENFCSGRDSASVVEDIRDEMERLKIRRAELDDKLRATIVDTMMEIADRNTGIKRLGGGAFTVRASQLAGKPWSPVYFDWHRAVDVLVGELDKMPKDEWIPALEKWLSKEKDGVVYVQKSHRTPIATELLSGVLGRLKAV